MSRYGAPDLLGNYFLYPAFLKTYRTVCVLSRKQIVGAFLGELGSRGWPGEGSGGCKGGAPKLPYIVNGWSQTSSHATPPIHSLMNLSVALSITICSRKQRDRTLSITFAVSDITSS